jgi:hypothetical protein
MLAIKDYPDAEHIPGVDFSKAPSNSAKEYFQIANGTEFKARFG